MLRVVETKFDNQVLTDMLNSFDSNDMRFDVIQMEYKYHLNSAGDKENSSFCTILYDDDKPLLFTHADYTYNVTDQGNEFSKSLFGIGITDYSKNENYQEICSMGLGMVDDFYSVHHEDILEADYFLAEHYKNISIHDCYGLNFDGDHWGYMLDSGCVQDLNQTEGWQKNSDDHTAFYLA